MEPKRNVYLMYGIALLQGMVFYGPIATLYRQAAGVSVFQITVIESASLALCILLELPWGVVADRIGYRKTMIFCSMLYVLSKMVFWRADSFGDFLLERLMLSVIMAGLSGCDVSILYLSCKKGESHKVFGIYHNLTTAGLLAAACFYSVFIGERYRLAGLLTVGTYGVAALLALGLKEVKETEHQNQDRRFCHYFVEVIKDKGFLAMLVGMAFLAETNQTITVFLNQLQYTRSGMTSTAIGIVYILVTLIGMTGAWSAGVTKRLGVTPFSVLTFGLSALACFLMAGTSSAFLSVVCMMSLRLASSLFFPLQQELQSQHIKTADRATVLSIYAVIMEGCGIVTNLMFGGAAQLGLPVAMGLGCVLCMAGMILLLAGYLLLRRADAMSFSALK